MRVIAYTRNTRAGTVAIRAIRDRWHVLLNDVDLGSYHSPESALDDVVGGHTFSPGRGIDTSKLGLPDSLGEWTEVRG